MATVESPLTTFADRLAAYDVSLTPVAPTDAQRAIAELLEPPAIGVPLPFEDVRLPAAVETAPTTADLRDARTGVTPGALGIADYGSVLIESDQEGTEPISLFNERHVVVLRRSDVVPGMPEAFRYLGERARTNGASAIIATGPSATADMGALVTGAHGPHEVAVVLVDDQDDAIPIEPPADGSSTGDEP